MTALTPEYRQFLSRFDLQNFPALLDGNGELSPDLTLEELLDAVRPLVDVAKARLGWPTTFRAPQYRDSLGRFECAHVPVFAEDAMKVAAPSLAELVNAARLLCADASIKPDVIIMTRIGGFRVEVDPALPPGAWYFRQSPIP